jgi:hypothetical protein
MPASALPTRISLAAFALLLLTPAPGAASAPTREQVQAALVYKFAQFVQWGPEAGSLDSGDGAAIIVGLLGSDAIRSELEAILRGKSLQGRPLEVRYFEHPEDVRDCRILVIDMQESRRELAMRMLPRKDLLTIGEGASFARQGGVIAIILEESRVRFDLNLAAAETAGLKIDPTLLGLAHEAGRW